MSLTTTCHKSTFADEEPKLKRGALVVHDRTWLEIWRMALTSPKLETYEDILRERIQTMGRSLTWMFVALTISNAANGGSQILYGNNQFNFNNNAEPLFDTTLVGLGFIIGSPILAGIGIVLWLFFLGLNQLIARYILGGTGTFEQLAFTTTAFYAPVAILSGLASFGGPVGSCGSALLGLYVLYLALVAMNATHQFGWTKAFIATYFVPLLLLCCMCAGIIMLVGSLSTDGTFQDILDSFISPDANLDVRKRKLGGAVKTPPAKPMACAP